MTDRSMSLFVTRVLTYSFLVFWCVGSYAHELRPTVADITVAPNLIEVSLRVNLEALMTEIGPEHLDSEDAPQAERYNRLRQMAPATLEAELQNYLPRLFSQISLNGNAGTRLPLALASVTIPPVDDTRLPRDSVLVLQATRPSAIDAISWHWARQYGPIILRAEEVEQDSEMELVSKPSQDTFSQYVQPGGTSDLIAIARGAIQSDGSSFGDYVLIGFEHIMPKGLDHILFVIGLFLLAPHFKHIAWQVSMFTIAHTLTLAMAISGMITLSARIVEPLIALSITVVCVENLFGSRFRTSRLMIVFAFGLLHGLGFAGVLSDVGLPTGQFVSSLLAFNIGVELGQLAVVLACFALVGWWFGNKPWYRTVFTIPASLAIGAVGLFWFLQRAELL